MIINKREAGFKKLDILFLKINLKIQINEKIGRGFKKEMEELLCWNHRRL